MALRSKTDVELSGELEAVATAAAERLRAVSGGDLEHDAELQRRVGEAASRAIAAGVSLASIADAERIGHGRVRAELGPELLRRVERAARHRREAEREYEEAVIRAGRLGLAHRDVAVAARVTHATVRAIIARARRLRGERRVNDARNRGAARMMSDQPRQIHPRSRGALRTACAWGSVASAVVRRLTGNRDSRPEEGR